jgi:hypothetical protein
MKRKKEGRKEGKFSLYQKLTFTNSDSRYIFWGDYWLKKYHGTKIPKVPVHWNYQYCYHLLLEEY